MDGAGVTHIHPARTGNIPGGRIELNIYFRKATIILYIKMMSLPLYFSVE